MNPEYEKARKEASNAELLFARSMLVDRRNLAIAVGLVVSGIIVLASWSMWAFIIPGIIWSAAAGQHFHIKLIDAEMEERGYRPSPGVLKDTLPITRPLRMRILLCLLSAGTFCLWLVYPVLPLAWKLFVVLIRMQLAGMQLAGQTGEKRESYFGSYLSWHSVWYELNHKALLRAQPLTRFDRFSFEQLNTGRNALFFAGNLFLCFSIAVLSWVLFSLDRLGLEQIVSSAIFIAVLGLLAFWSLGLCARFQGALYAREIKRVVNKID